MPKFAPGERVLCYEPDPFKVRVIYDAKVIRISTSEEISKSPASGHSTSTQKHVQTSKEDGTFYFVHFQGWSHNWDRHVPETFLLKINEENRLVQRTRFEEAEALQTTKKSNSKKRRSSSTASKPDLAIAIPGASGMDRIAENAMPLTEESLQAAASSPVNPNPHSTTPSAIQNNSAKKPKSSQKKVSDSSQSSSICKTPKEATDKDILKRPVSAASSSDVSSSKLSKVDDDFSDLDKNDPREEQLIDLKKPWDFLLEEDDLPIEYEYEIPEGIKRVLNADYIERDPDNEKKDVRLELKHASKASVLSAMEDFLTFKEAEAESEDDRSTKTNNNNSNKEMQRETSEKNLSLCKEYLDGLRIMFDFYVENRLLYQNEVPLQRPEVRSRSASPRKASKSSRLSEDSSSKGYVNKKKMYPHFHEDSKMPATYYPPIFLLRLLVILPQILKEMKANQSITNVVLGFSEDLMNFVDQRSKKFI